MLLSWRPMALADLLRALDLTCKALESTGASAHLLTRKFLPFLSWSVFRHRNNSSLS